MAVPRWGVWLLLWGNLGKHMDDKAKAARQERWTRIRKTWWPDITTELGFKTALGQGWGIAAFGAVCYAGLFVAAIAFGFNPFGEELTGVAWTAALGILLVFAGAGALLAWLVKKRTSKVAAVVVLAWIGFETVAKLAEIGPAGIVSGIFFTLCAINGVRATFARYRPTTTADVKTFS